MFTVELHMPPVVDDAGFAPLRAALDLAPGSLLLEDRDDPVIVMLVDTRTAARAHLFAEALLSDAGLAAERVTVAEADDDDDVDYAALGIDLPAAPDHQVLPTRAEQLQRWANELPVAI